MAASNGFIPGEYDESKDKPMMLMKKGSSDGHGITALISRQLQGNKIENRWFFLHFVCVLYIACGSFFLHNRKYIIKSCLWTLMFA